jgi:hypothetical protein
LHSLLMEPPLLLGKKTSLPKKRNQSLITYRSPSPSPSFQKKLGGRHHSLVAAWWTESVWIVARAQARINEDLIFLDASPLARIAKRKKRKSQKLIL